jgi:hypothetical protein
MEFLVKFSCDNAAFGDDPIAHEIGRILREIIKDVESGHRLPRTGGAVAIHDVNGNSIGFWQLHDPFSKRPDIY